MLQRFLTAALLTVLLAAPALANPPAKLPPKREFRAAWIATVGNIDWPSRMGLSTMMQQHEFISRLDSLQNLGINAVIVQIRPACDALYPSELEPWSCYLSGKQGQAPVPYYDPMSFMIAEAHKRNMEFHAWFNPFRALVNSRKNPNPPAHITRSKPSWVLSYGGKSYLDPGLPETREYVINVISDVVKRYDIDAVHLDDYFYPYRIAGQEFPDSRSYGLHGKDFSSRADWRRNNVNLFVSALSSRIKHIKPYVKFGISPFGIWRNASEDPLGSNTRGATNYGDLYADVLVWMRKGWLDYLLPQLYWERRHRAAAFDVLLPWWENHAYGRHIYYGLGVYRMVGASSGPWAGTGELLAQISDIRNQTATPGISFYSASSFDKIGRAIRDSLSRRYMATIAFPPTMKWIDSIPPAIPQLRVTTAGQGQRLQWKHHNPKAEPVRFAIYRFVNGEPVVLDRADRIISLQTDTAFTDADAWRYGSCTYVVTALDRLWNESGPSNAASWARR